MKFGWILVTFLAIVVITPDAKADYTKTKTAVLDFQLQGEGYETEDLGEIIAEWLVTALVKEGRFEVVERRLLKKIIIEQQLAESGILDEQSTAKLGRILGVKVVISGSVMRIQNMTEVNARIIDVESGSILTAENVRSASTERLEDLISQMAQKIIKDFPLEGYVVFRDNEKITIDLGTQTGVKQGMQFVAYREGNVIKHPKTGEVLDVEKIETGILEIHTVRDKIAQGVVLRESTTAPIEYGHMVKSIAQTKKRTTARLFVDAVPVNARIRILNIRPKYHPGIELKPGKYHIEVSSPGYRMQKKWITVDAGEDRRLKIELE